MMKKYLTFLIIFTFLISACNKPNEKKVSYKATGAISAYNLQYLNDQNELIKLTVEPQSAQDVWKYEFMADQGGIVYVNGSYKDINSALKIVPLFS